MAIGPVQAATIQVGKETARGAEVSATRIIIPQTATLQRLEELQEFENRMTGVLSRTIRPPINVRSGANLSIVQELDFEQSLLPFMAGMHGGRSGATLDTNARAWTFSPPTAGNPIPDTFTIEAIEDDFTNERNHQFLYGFVTELSVSADLGTAPTLSYTMMGRRVKTGTAKTASISLPNDLHPAQSSDQFSMYVDDAWTALGTTQVQGQILSFAWTWNNFIFPRYTMDGRTDRDLANYGFRGGRLADLTAQVLVDTNSGFVPDEEQHKSNGDGRAVRLELDTGVLIGSTSATRLIRIDGYYNHATDSLQDRFGQEQDGEMVATLHLMSTHEATANKDSEVRFQNVLAAFP